MHNKSPIKNQKGTNGSHVKDLLNIYCFKKRLTHDELVKLTATRITAEGKARIPLEFFRDLKKGEKKPAPLMSDNYFG